MNLVLYLSTLQLFLFIITLSVPSKKLIYIFFFLCVFQAGISYSPYFLYFSLMTFVLYHLSYAIAFTKNFTYRFLLLCVLIVTILVSPLAQVFDSFLLRISHLLLGGFQVDRFEGMSLLINKLTNDVLLGLMLKV